MAYLICNSEATTYTNGCRDHESAMVEILNAFHDMERSTHRNGLLRNCPFSSLYKATAGAEMMHHGHRSNHFDQKGISLRNAILFPRFSHLDFSCLYYTVVRISNNTRALHLKRRFYIYSSYCRCGKTPTLFRFYT